MDDQLDNDLKDRIREVFDNYEDTSAADEGWLLLREKFPEKEDRRGLMWMWWGSAAAVLLIFFALFMALNKKPQTNNLAVKPTKGSQPTNIAATPTKTDNGATSPNKGTGIIADTTANKANAVKEITYAGRNTPKKVATKISKAGVAPLVIPGNTLTQSGLKPVIKPNVLPKQMPIDTAPVKNTIAVTPGKKKNGDSTKRSLSPVQNAPVQSQSMANNVVKPDNTPPKSIMIKPKAPDNSIISMFNADKQANAPKKIDKPENYDKRVRFGLYAATYFNYAKGSDNQVNLGAGISSDIRISKNLKLVTGVSIAQNSLKYNSTNQAIEGIQQNNLVLASTYNVSAVATHAVAAPTFKNYNASLVGLDVPLNLKYEFNPQKGNTYILAGVSSGTFINEAYTYQYNYPSFFSPSAQQTQDQTDRKSFNGFYFAKTLNVAFGVGYPLGKSNKLIIEPFLKYPLDGLGSQQIRFGSGGLNLKFSFQTKK